MRHLPTGARRALWVAGLLVVLAGVLGMHGLSTHGVEAVVPTVSHDHASASLGAATEVVPAMVSTGSRELLAAVAGSSDHDRSHLSGGVCLAVLGSLVALLLLLRQRRLPGSLPWTPAPPRSAPLTRVRSPDPPNLFVLSVQRC